MRLQRCEITDHDISIRKNRKDKHVFLVETSALASGELQN